MRKPFILFAATMMCLTMQAQSFVHETSSTYQWPKEPQVREKLQTWQDLKFGIILHWGV